MEIAKSRAYKRPARMPRNKPSNGFNKPGGNGNSNRNKEKACVNPMRGCNKPSCCPSSNSVQQSRNQAQQQGLWNVSVRVFDPSKPLPRTSADSSHRHVPPQQQIMAGPTIIPLGQELMNPYNDTPAICQSLPQAPVNMKPASTTAFNKAKDPLRQWGMKASNDRRKNSGGYYNSKSMDAALDVSALQRPSLSASSKPVGKEVVAHSVNGVSDTSDSLSCMAVSALLHTSQSQPLPPAQDALLAAAKVLDRITDRLDEKYARLKRENRLLHEELRELQAEQRKVQGTKAECCYISDDAVLSS